MFLVLLAAILIPFSGHASGGGGTGGINSGNLAGDYDIGKKVFYEQVVCSTCPYNTLILTANDVAAIRPELERSGDLGRYMSARDRQLVQYYISRRFNL